MNDTEVRAQLRRLEGQTASIVSASAALLGRAHRAETETVRLREERDALRSALFGLLCCLEVRYEKWAAEERTLTLTENCLPGFVLDEYDRAVAAYNATRKEGER